MPPASLPALAAMRPGPSTSRYRMIRRRRRGRGAGPVSRSAVRSGSEVAGSNPASRRKLWEVPAGLIGRDENEVGGHQPPGGVVLVVEEAEQAAGGGRWHVAEQLVAVLPLQLPQGIDRLVGLHPCHQAGGLLWRRLLQQGVELAGLH